MFGMADDRQLPQQRRLLSQPANGFEDGLLEGAGFGDDQRVGLVFVADMAGKVREAPLVDLPEHAAAIGTRVGGRLPVALAALLLRDVLGDLWLLRLVRRAHSSSRKEVDRNTGAGPGANAVVRGLTGVGPALS